MEFLSVLWVSIPYSFYPIHLGNNTLILNDGADSVTIEPGYYSSAMMASALQTQLKVINPSFSVSISLTTAKISIACAGPFKINSVSSQTSSTFAPLLGFVYDVVASPTLTLMTAVATSIVNIAGPQYLYVVSDFLGKLRNRHTTSATDQNKHALAVVPVNTGFGGFLYAEPLISFQINKALEIQPTDTIDFKLIDDKGNTVNLNGCDWSIAFSIKRDFS
jgi:hypothetical protein